MSLSAGFFQKDLLNTFNSDGTTYNAQSNGTAEQNSLLSHTIQLSAEQATQLGLKFYDSETDDLSGVMASTDQVFNLPHSNNLEGDVINVNEDLNPHRIFKNPNINSQSFVIKPIANNSSALNRNAQFRKTMDEISELLSFNNDEEGTVYLQNNSFNKNQTSQLQYNQPVNSQVMHGNSTDNSKQVKYVLPKTINTTTKPYRFGQPISRVNYTNQTLTLPNAQKISIQHLLNQGSLDTNAMITSDAKRPVSVVPIKKQNRVKSILFKPTIPTSNNQGNTTAIPINNNTHTMLNQIGTKVPKLVPLTNDRRTTVIRGENIPRAIQPLPNNTKIPNPTIDNLPYKIEYRLDLLDNNIGQNSGYTLSIPNKENATQSTNDSQDISTAAINSDLLNKTVALTSKIENSIVPLSMKRKSITSVPETNAVQEALQRYPVNANKPLGSTDNPIKLVQKGQTFHSLHSLNESQLSQIAGALKHRPPHQQSGDREPHKVVLYDSATHTRIIYRIVYPDELDLKPGPDAEEKDNKESTVQKEKRKRKMKLNPLPEPIPQENKQPLPRTRTGRIIRPPNRIINDYKRLRVDDGDKEEWIDVDEEPIAAHVMVQDNDKPSETPPQEVTVDPVIPENPAQDSANNIPPTKTRRSLNSKFRCPTCNKIYLGYGRMSKHLAMYPDHAELDQLGIDPPSKNKLKKNYSFKPKLTNGTKSNENKDESEGLNRTEKSDESCSKTLFECLMQKIENFSGPEKWNVLCNQLTNFMQDAQKFVQSQVTSNNIDNNSIPKDNASQVTINDAISRITNLEPGKYTLKETFLSKEDKDKSISLPSSCSPMKLILEDYNQQLDNNIVSNLNIDFERNVLSNSRSELQRQMDILIDEDACQNLSSLPETHSAVRDNIENINTIRDSINLSGDDGMVYQNVDDLVHESLKNLTADEIAAVPPLEHSPDDLVNSQSSLQDLSLDLFQFHHN